MTTIQQIISSFQIDSKNRPNQANDNGGFDALLAGLDNTMAGSAKTATTDSVGGNNDQIFALIQQLYSNTTDFLLSIGSEEASASHAVTTNATSGIFDDAGEGFITGDGPLPAFLAQVDQRYGLDAAHQKALRDITLQFRDTDGSPAMIAKLGEALAAAGIGEKPAVNA